MSSEVAVRVENLSKCYQIYNEPRDRLKQSIMPRLQRLSRRQPKQYFHEFWALKDISLQIKRGESVGIIGRNGSGKSTLLQLICGTLNPTTGSVQVDGRVAALLELGAGFNPEFTGRENVYVAAKLYGLTDEQIDARFERIAAFADIGDFISQPVKTYSSGMYVRLAFAVIAHVDADILVVDEALAVGDAIFTQKCLRFIRSFQGRGTLLFVSHDTAAVQNLCDKAVWLNCGGVQMIGNSKEVAEAYFQFTLQEIYGDEAKLSSTAPAPDVAAGDTMTPLADTTPAAIDYAPFAGVRHNIAMAKGWKTGKAEITSIFLARLSPGPERALEGGESVRMTIRAKASERMKSPILGFLVRDRLGQDLFGENTLAVTRDRAMPVEAGATLIGEFDFQLPMLPNGQYAVMASVADGTLHEHVQHHWMHDALIITVSSSKVRYGLVGIRFDRVELKHLP